MPTDSTATAKYPIMIEPDHALQLVLQNIPEPATCQIPLSSALGHTLAQDIQADQDYPAFDRAMMDGFAARLADAGCETEIVGEAAAGRPCDITLQDGQCVSIMTGGLCPPGSQVVVPIENTEQIGRKVRLPGELKSGKHIAHRGSECAQGHTVLKQGQTIGPLAIADLATFGYQNVGVYKRPTLAILPTGTELVQPEQTPGPGQIRDSNSAMLAAAAMALGVEQPSKASAPDSPDKLSDAISQQLQNADMLLLTGGVSAGKYDLVPDVLKSLGARIIFHKVKQKPGKPILFARIENKLIFALPGNPLSAMIGFARYVSVAIRKWSGQPDIPTGGHGTLTEPVDNKGQRTRFIFSRAATDPDYPDRWQIQPLVGQGSADIYATAPANCTISLDPESDYAAGTTFNFEWIGPNS